MQAIDFQYDNLFLSDFGCIICEFDSGGSPETISMGSEITFTKTSVSNGRRFMITDAKYEDCIETEFSICKNPDLILEEKDKYFTLEQQRDLIRWLNRTEMLDFSILDNEHIDIFYEGSFNVDKIELNGRVIGMNLRFQSNRPFGIGKDIIYSFDITLSKTFYIIQDTSDEIGYDYPKVEITPTANGNLTITNGFDGRQTIIKNCVNGEKITMENLTIESTNQSHNATIMNDFNFKYLRICNAYNNTRNKYEFSLPCHVTITYRPIRKVGI